MNKVCLVFDIDETILHFGPDDYEPRKFEYEENIIDKDRTVFRPGFKDFIDYVNSTEGKIILGIWTYGSKDYASKMVERIEKRYNNSKKLFKFVYSRENMTPGMLNKELDYIINKHSADLGIGKYNTFLVDNRPANLIHQKNVKNGIIVESFEGNPKKSDIKMFEKLKNICISLLTTGKIPNKYIKLFYIRGIETPITSIGTSFDDGFTPILKTTRRGKGKSKKTRRKTL